MDRKIGQHPCAEWIADLQLNLSKRRRDAIFHAARRSAKPDQLPAQLLQPTNGKLLWLVDQAAGSMLSNAIRE